MNGKIQPYCNVRKRRYRFRLLNVGPSRHYQLFMTNPDNPAQSIPYWRISNDGNLYEKPLLVTSMKLAVAERADIVVDFAKLTAPGGPAAGATRLWLENRLIQTNPRKPETDLDPAGTAKNVLLEWRIGAPAYDASRELTAQTSFAPLLLPPLPPIEETITRHFKWERTNGAWACNGKFIDCTEVRFAMKRGRTERWIHETSGGWAHPVHNHFVEGRIVKRNGKPVGPGSQEYCRKDVIALYPGDEVEYWVTATDYLGVYPIHCHNVLHEDYGMMMLFRVDDVGDTNPATLTCPGHTMNPTNDDNTALPRRGLLGALLAGGAASVALADQRGPRPRRQRQRGRGTRPRGAAPAPRAQRAAAR